MKPLFTLLFSLCLLLSARAQTGPLANALYIELGANALFYSINYERGFLKNRAARVHLGAGIYGIRTSYFTVPLGANYLFALRGRSSFIDLGFGATYCKADVALYAIVDHRNPAYKNNHYWNYVPSLAYRKTTKKKLMLRFSVAPVINHNDALPFLGFSIGKYF
jgi:hypothetical protein